MKRFLIVNLLLLLLLPFTVFAQPGAVNPDLLDCGMQGNVDIICGTRAPEDFEVTPVGRFLIVANFGQGSDPALDLFELENKHFTELSLTADKTSGWGQDDCIHSIGSLVSPHGLSLSQRSSGEWQLYVVNHNQRESMEMYELLPTNNDNSWTLVWRGCVLAEEPYNDVSALPDGSFVATRPQAIQTQGQDIFAGDVSGNVGVWTASNGEKVLPNSEYGYPNGVLVSEDGRYAYVSGWTTRSFHKYDMSRQEEVASIHFTYMPDNLTWTAEGNILAAGINGVAGNCPASSSNPCIQGFVVSEINPDTLAEAIVFDSEGRGLINGTSVAIEADGNVYVGSFQGTRLVKFPR